MTNYNAVSPITVKTGTQEVKNYDPYFIIPKNSDVRILVSSTATGQIITGDIQGYLATIV